FYLAPGSPSSPDATVMGVDILLYGSGFKSQKPHPLFKSNAMLPQLGQHNPFNTWASIDMPYDVSADGQRFLINEHHEPDKRTPTTVIVNWSHELAKK